MVRARSPRSRDRAVGGGLLCGRAAGLVVVDRPAPPAESGADASQGREDAWLRAIANDPAAHAAAPAGRTDTRTRHGVTPRADAAFAAWQRAAVKVPVLDLEAA